MMIGIGNNDMGDDEKSAQVLLSFCALAARRRALRGGGGDWRL